MTEDEAKTKWCPFVRFRGESVTYNRMSATRDNNYLYINHCNCIASQCMMWQWTTPEHGHCGLVKDTIIYDNKD